MKIKNQLKPIIFYNYLADPRKEGRHISWKILHRNFLFFTPLKNMGFFLNKSSSLNYKYRFVASIIGKYIYIIKKQLKLYSMFLLFFKKLSQNKYYRKNSLYYKKIYNFRTKKYIFNKYKRHLFLWCKKWFKKRYKKQRKLLWGTFHKVSNNFWGFLLKKRIKSYIFYILKNTQIKRKLSMKTYDSIVKSIFFFIKKKKYRNLWKNKQKKYRLNITMPVYLKKIKYLQNKQHYQHLYPLLKNNTNINEQSEFDFNNMLLKSNSLFNNNINLYLFFNNYYYYLYFLNLKNTNNNSNYILIFYKKLVSIYNKKYIYSNKKKKLLLRTGLLKINKSFSSLQHGKYINIFLYWLDNYLTNNYSNSNKMIYYLLNSYCNTTIRKVNSNFFISKYNTSIIFTYKKPKISLFILSNKTNFKNLTKCFFLKNRKSKKFKIKKNNKSWYKLNNFYKYKRHKNKKYFFYPYGNRMVFLKKFKKFIKLRKIKTKKKKKIVLNKKNKIYYIRKIKKINIKKSIKKFHKKKKIIKKIFNLQKKNKLFLNKKFKNNIFSKYIKKQKLHFLKKYKRRYKKKLNFIRKLKQNKFNNRKKNKKKDLVDFIKYNDKKQILFNKYKKFGKKIRILFKKYFINIFFFIFYKKKYIKYDKNNLRLYNKFTIEKEYENIDKNFVFNKNKIYKNNFYFLSLNKAIILKEFIINCIMNLKDKKYNLDRKYTTNLKNKIVKLEKYNIDNILEIQLESKYHFVNLNEKYILSNIRINCTNYRNVYSKSLYTYYNWIITEFVKSFYFQFFINYNTNSTFLYKNYMIY